MQLFKDKSYTEYASSNFPGLRSFKMSTVNLFTRYHLSFPAPPGELLNYLFFIIFGVIRALEE